ncbi:SEN34 [Candida margitis]|uniref:SEN34 n=1 Tax=Candida margitis TaxID=1775924 RepID=UPI002225FA20|nr:SEN34 [Candida margitis]KAI5970826.1 SEN34 [Candida margitis]
MQNDITTHMTSLNETQPPTSIDPALKQHTYVSPILLPVISPSSNPEVLVFNLDDIKQLRNNCHILGVLIGTLQQYPQQNIFLSVPLKLNIYEVLWLVEYQYAILIDQLAYRSARLKLQQESLQGGIVENDNLTKNNILVTDNCESDRDSNLAQSFAVPIKSYLNAYFRHNNDRKSLDQFIKHYKYYKFLQNHGFYINPGLKFGGDLVIYPGDPLRYHSYSMVKFDVVDMYDIIVGGRLATSVKKNLILMELKGEGKNENSKNDGDEVCVDDKFLEALFDDDDDDDDEPMCFSIEWAGFG